MLGDAHVRFGGGTGETVQPKGWYGAPFLPYEKLNGPTVLREGAFLVGRGRLAREEAPGLRCFLDDIVPLGGRGAHLSAIAVAVEQRRDDVPPPSSLIA